MIALDTSALMAIVLDEPQAAQCISAIEAEDELVISAWTVAETLIVSARRNVEEEVAGLLDGLGVEVVNAGAAAARRISVAYSKWGKGGASGRPEFRRLLCLRSRQGARLPASLCWGRFFQDGCGARDLAN